MTPQERKSLAEQLESNILLQEILAEIETYATELLIYAKTEDARVSAQAGVLSAREFKSKMLGAIASRRGAKPAPT